MKKLRLALFGFILIPTGLYAAPPYHPSGSSLTYGQTSNPQSIYSSANNPAAGATGLSDGEGQFRMGIFTFGAGVELGDISEIETTIDDVGSSFDALTVTDSTDLNEIDTAIKGLNTSLAAIDQDGYAKVFVSFQPVMPLILSHDWIGGTLSFNINISAISKISVLHDPIDFDTANPTAGDVSVVDGTTISISNDTTLLAKAAAIAEGSVGYSRRLWSSPDGDFYGGATGKFLRVGLTQLNERLDSTTDSGSSFDNIEDGEFTDTTDFGVDLGVLWVAPHYRLGLIASNINEPSFEFNAPTTTGYTTNSAVIQRLTSSSKYNMDSQLTLEGAAHTESKNWVFNVSLDANEVKDPFGDEYQWLVASAAYATDAWWLPGIRFGTRKNLAGSEITYLTGGVSWAVANIDLAYATDTIKFEGSDEPRGLIFNIGFSMSL